MWNDYGFIRPGRSPDYIPLVPPTPPPPIIIPPTILLSNSTVLDTASIGTTIGVLSTINGTPPYTFTLTSNPESLFAISGSNLNVAASLMPTPPVVTAIPTYFILGF